MSDSKFRKLVLSAIALLGILLYSGTLKNSQFLFDGEMFLKNNPLFKDLAYYVELLDVKAFSTLDEQLGLHQDVTTNFMMRPVSYITFSINYILFGFNAVAFRSVNILIHIFNSALVFLCIRLFLNVSTPSSRLSNFSLRFIPAVTSSVFLLHPMQTESVTYITQRFSSLGALFYLSTIYIYLLWSDKKVQGRMQGFLRLSSIVVLLFGMFTRESLFTAPFMILLIEMLIFESSFAAGVRKVWPYLLMLPVIPVMTIIVSAAQTDSVATLSGAINSVNYNAVPVLHYALSQLVVVLKYLSLYLFPYGQNVDPDPLLYTLPYQLPVVASAITILLLIGGAYFLYIRNRGDIRYRLILTGICWYFLGLAVSSTFIPLPDLMAEHRAYFPSVGFLMALVSSLDLLRTGFCNERGTNILLWCTIVWCVLLSAATFNRNDVWHSRIKLWSDSVKKSPMKERPWYNLGASYLKKGIYHEALKCFKKVVEINPDSGKGYEMLAVSYLQLSQYQDVIDASIKGISVDPANPVIYNNLGIAYARIDRAEDAKQAFSTALALLPGYERARLNLDKLESYIESSVGR
ncbi:MAG: tetratricopeptide repeat protein [Desulfuromonadaceae bacterium]|nr:tetratricopeptide repeat protein [Desulfuromonadaceae bacterium]MDD2856481.1 tetratricopeptide repeat protein [Desulfuromonadaceae bacterium]